jgi:hemolysin activation/secretion protein
VRLRLSQIGALGTQPYYASAVQKILERLRDRLVAQKYLGVYVAPDPRDINENSDDLRSRDRTTLTLVVTVGMVTEARTVAGGERFGQSKSLNNPLHANILEHSPIQPHREGDPGHSDLLHRDTLDNYLFQLSRHPGRRVDVALSPSLEVGGVVLDYLITENRPWSAYAQVSNTGTRQTDEVRERFGFFHNQLTENDDILAVEYATANFDDAHNLNASYEAPWFDHDQARWRVTGGYGEFTASEVGQSTDRFTGRSWSVGAELIANLYQDRDFFIDLLAGGRFMNVQVDNTLPGTQEGKGDLFFPHVGAQVEQICDSFTTRGLLQIEGQFSHVTGVDQSDLDNLGRFGPDNDWAVLSWDFTRTFYLEPLFEGQPQGNLDPSENQTLAHEISLSVRGQYAFDHRLIPQVQEVVGGFYTVRGYQESVVAGDTAVILNAEYRYHIPHAFAVEPQPRKLFGDPFRFAPQYTYGRPDWDLIARTFIDAGFTGNAGGVDDSGATFPAEPGDTLVGTGVGLEFTYKRNVSLRADWGIALTDTDNDQVTAGSNRFHLVATFLY